jgi:hypothetical protein
MPVDKIHFHIDFFKGTTDTEYFKDFATFDIINNPQDKLHFNRIEIFAKSALRGDVLIGKNVENNGSYAGYDTWHYHSGPWSKISRASSTKVDSENPLGARSGSAIHYTWQGDFNELVILGYSPVKHDKPFPQLSNKNNPLKKRVRGFDDPYDDTEIEDLSELFKG